jgi:single-stranded DNA-binding protein
MTNTIKLQGNASQAPTISATKNHTIVAHLTIAADREGSRTSFIPVIAFAEAAETIDKRVTTGTKVEIIGHVTHSAKYGTQIVATFVKALDRALVVA